MSQLAPRSQAAFTSAALATLLGACAVSTPFKSTAQATASAVLVVTHGVLDPRTRAAFDAQTRKVVDGLPVQPGLLGYSVRRQLLGNQVWTLTVWADEASRARFVASACTAKPWTRAARPSSASGYGAFPCRAAACPCAGIRP